LPVCATALVMKERAPDVPYDHGVYELVEEPLDAAEPAPREPMARPPRRRLSVIAGP
jgi:hypothetical protein